MLGILVVAVIMVSLSPGGAKAGDDDYVTIQTTKGKIVILLFPEEAPITVKNFKKLVKKGYYDGLSFYHVVTFFYAKAGSPKGGGKDNGDTLPIEMNNRKVLAGTVGMFRIKPDKSSGSIFFISFIRQNWLDGEYTVFGQVMSGLEEAKSLLIGDKIIKAGLGRK